MLFSPWKALRELGRSASMICGFKTGGDTAYVMRTSCGNNREAYRIPTRPNLYTRSRSSLWRDVSLSRISLLSSSWRVPSAFLHTTKDGGSRDLRPIRSKRIESKSTNKKRSQGPSLSIYCDGSLMDGNAGAAAVLCRTGEQDMMVRRHFKAQAPLTSVDAEVIALALGCVLLSRFLRTTTDHISSVTIGCDNTSAIDAGDLKKKPNGLFEELLQNRIRALNLNYPNLKMSFERTPGHAGVPGNVKAHLEARKVARDPLCATDERLPDILRRMVPATAAKPSPPSSVTSMFTEMEALLSRLFAGIQSRMKGRQIAVLMAILVLLFSPYMS